MAELVFTCRVAPYQQDDLLVSARDLDRLDWDRRAGSSNTNGIGKEFVLHRPVQCKDLDSCQTFVGKPLRVKRVMPGDYVASRRLSCFRTLPEELQHKLVEFETPVGETKIGGSAVPGAPLQGLGSSRSAGTSASTSQFGPSDLTGSTAFLGCFDASTSEFCKGSPEMSAFDPAGENLQSEDRLGLHVGEVPTYGGRSPALQGLAVGEVPTHGGRSPALQDLEVGEVSTHGGRSSAVQRPDNPKVPPEYLGIPATLFHQGRVAALRL